MIHQDVIRWIRASVNKQFTDYLLAATPAIPLICENTDNSGSIKNKEFYAELSIQGPRVLSISKTEFRHDIDISILCTVVLSDDTQMIDRMVGIVLNAMTNTLFAVKYGDGAGDDQSQFGCIVLRSDVPRPIDTVQWGQLDPETKITQTVVEGYFKLET